MEQDKVISISSSITVDELARSLNIPVATLVGELFKNGIIATINQRIDFETATIIIDELGFKVKLKRKDGDVGKLNSPSKKKHKLTENAISRPPIVAVMGHVDHGKTTLLDTLLDKKTAETEAGGITQHISAYQVEHDGRLITFLDTPGHEAFAALRQHSAVLTDIVVVVVAADDGVKPQTVEAIKFARSANAKIIIAISKIDKTTADTNRVMAQLAADHGLNPEEWGGDAMVVPISAAKGKNLDKLLDMILLTADIEELRADLDVPAEGLVIESHMETGKGSVVNLLIEQGILENGDFIVAGKTYGKIRTMLDFKGSPKGKAEPSTPVTVTGFRELPQFGDHFEVVVDEKTAKRLAQKTAIELEKDMATTNITGLDMLKMISQRHDQTDFNVVVKADVLGSVTSIVDNLKLIDTGGEINLTIVGSGVGGISENDIHLAASGKAIIYGFNTDMTPNIKRLALRERVEVRLFRVIYELLDDAKASMEKLLSPDVVEDNIGELSVKGVFRIVREEVIAGGEVTSGKVMPGVMGRVFRKKELIAEVEVTSVQHERQEVKMAVEGEMCGLSLKTAKKVSIEIGDKIVFFTRELKPKKL